MKKNFKKSLAVMMAVLMLLSAVGVTCLAAYTITYNPGTYGNETDLIVKVEVPGKQTIKASEALYTRDGYVQTGWSTSKSGARMAVECGGDYEVTRSRTLYPYWEAKGQQVTFAPGEFGVGTAQTVDVPFNSTTKAPGAIFTREGYTLIGWASVDGATVAEFGATEDTPAIQENVTYYPVWRLNIYSAEVDVTELKFGVSCIGYSAIAEQIVKITNTGNVTLNYTLPTDAAYEVVVSKGALQLAEGETVEISIKPVSGLAVADYAKTLDFACDSANASVSVSVAFKVVNHSFGKYVSDENATYTANGTKTATCLNGCGASDTIVDEGSMKIYSADNNDALGLSSKYEHHRTVRFTAFGSGMDDEEGVVGKRFVPVSWYVNDDFNGTFDNGYDVVFTHTVFGEYTLTINYVEEEYNAETDEWTPTGVTDEKTFDYTVGTTAEEEQEIIRPNTILTLIFGLFAELLKLLGLGA